MSSPATLPITTDTPLTTTTTSPAFTRFLSRLTTTFRHTFSQSRPWYELIDRTAFSRPENLSDAISRIRKNSSYFRINYLTLIAIVLALFLISHIFSLLLLLSLLASWCFFYFFRPPDQPVILFGRSFSDKEMLGVLSLLTVVVVFLTSVGSLLISAVLTGVFGVCAHGAFRVPEDLFLDDQDGNNSGLLSFLGGAASSAAVAAAAGSAGRV